MKIASDRIPENAGKVIREQREAAQLSQADLAAMSGTSQSTVSRVENGRVSELYTPVALLRVLGLDGDESELIFEPIREELEPVGWVEVTQVESYEQAGKTAKKYSDNGDFVRAHWYIAAMLELASNPEERLDAQNLLGISANAHGRYLRARRLFYDVIDECCRNGWEREPICLRAQANLAELHVNQGRLDMAEDAAAGVLHRKPGKKTRAYVRYVRGRVAFHRGETETALEDMRRAREELKSLGGDRVGLADWVDVHIGAALLSQRKTSGKGEEKLRALRDKSRPEAAHRNIEVHIWANYYLARYARQPSAFNVAVELSRQHRYLQIIDSLRSLNI